MIEAEFEIFQNVCAVVMTIVNAGCLAVLYFPFLTHSVEKRRKTVSNICWIMGVYIVVALSGMYLPWFGILGILLVIVALSLLSPVFEIDKNFDIFLSTLFFSFDSSIRLIGNSVLYLVNRREVSEGSVDKGLSLKAGVYGGLYIIQFLSLALLVYWIGHKVIKRSYTLKSKELASIVVVPVIGIMFDEIISRLLFVMKGDTWFGIYDEYPAFLICIPIIAILFCIGNIAGISTYQSMYELTEEKRRLYAERLEIRAVRERMTEVEQFYTGIRKIRHEMRNHLTNIKGLIKNENYEDIDAYITKIDDSLGKFEISDKTGNPILDVVISDKRKESESKGIRFDSEFKFPIKVNIDAYDMAVVVSNILSNAIEACEETPKTDTWIKITSKEKSGFFIVEVKNPYLSGEIKRDSSGKLKSSKEDELFHGVGLTNVSDIAGKYIGSVDIDTNNNVFSVTVLLQSRKDGREK